MIDHRLIRENPGEVEKQLQRRDPGISLQPYLELDHKRRNILQEEERLKQVRNKVSQEIAEAKRQGGDAQEKILEMQKIAGKIKELEEERRGVEKAWHKFLTELPNIPHEGVPVGTTEEDNKIISSWGEKPEFSFEPRPHWELGENLDILDIPRGGKVAGSRFVFMKGDGALLERALINFFIDYHTTHHSYQEIFPPFLANSDSMFGTGQLPKFAQDLFYCPEEELYLIPTAEVPLTNIFREEVLKNEDLPIKVCGYSACFRSEAGAHGRDTRGIIRQHQFNKVELVNFTSPKNSWEQLEVLVSEAEKILQLLELPYRKVGLCTGDLGFASAFTYDLEVWVPSSNKYREISSCTNFTDFQARRAQIRYRPASGEKAEYAHTLNGSGLAVGRTVVAIMENFQDQEGKVHIPRVLQDYMGGKKVIGG